MADSVAQGATSPKSPASPRSTQSAGSPRSESGPAVTEQAVVEVDQQEVDEFDERLYEFLPPFTPYATLSNDVLMRIRSSYTASLSSSVVDYPVEHGRRYHAYKRGVYLMPNDDREQVRLDVMHHIMVRTNRHLISCAQFHYPFSNPRSIG
ncbi:hypothetical protein IMZ48_26895 [Candidatus Bathyarchaeota archaeon]|nr:hypothetical protein [Candidatus Bathyarchaeota archaeon]